MELLLSRPVVVALAIIGAILATGASALKAAGKLSDAQARRINVAGYIVMGASMLLFALAGLLGRPS
jgi:multisubunit Na+/H+ antiporter MnhB subunit